MVSLSGCRLMLIYGLSGLVWLASFDRVLGSLYTKFTSDLEYLRSNMLVPICLHLISLSVLPNSGGGG
jgi:hypothetical protein